jgi:hypothetical protein
MRYSSSQTSVGFWSKTKRFFKLASASLHAFVLINGEIVRENSEILEIAADH